MLSLNEQIRRKALEIGFHKIGFARAEVLREEGERLKSWLGENFHGEMSWIEREPEKRADPRLIFADAKSVVAVALNYFTAHEHEENRERGKISRYAWGDDYHDVLKEKLGELLAFIKSIDETADGKICVDTAPAMDKAWAARAGLGWIGKHSNLITKEFGSWVFLGEILLNVELDEYEREPLEDFCGSCRRCLDECPTGAIVEPRVVDSNRCLSYATIELRAPEFSAEIKENLNGWLYGCDICQDVCPWNRFEQPTEENRFEPRFGETSIALENVSAFSADQYAERFRRSPVKRAKLAGLQRNVQALKENKKS